MNGHPDPISGKYRRKRSSDLIVVFRPAKARPSVARVKFTNTGDCSGGHAANRDARRGCRRRLYRGGLPLLLDTTARPRYEARGMLRAAFPKIETQPAKDMDGIEVTVQVEPGPVYKLGRVSFAGSDTSNRED